MEAAAIVQRIAITLGHALASESTKPIEVKYESAEGVDLDYSLCSVCYLHMPRLQNLVNMPVDLWVAVVYKLDESGKQSLGFSVAHNKIAPCELNVYPIGSIDHAVGTIKKFFYFSLLPYFELQGFDRSVNIAALAQKYGNAEAWGNTITIHLKAESFPYDVDFTGGVFRGFSDRILAQMIQDVQQVIGTSEELKHRVFTSKNDIGVIFIPNSTYKATKNVPKEL